MDKLTLKQYPPEIDEQIKYQAKLIKDTKDEIKGRELHGSYGEWMDNQLRFQEAIYQTLCIAKWVVELCTNDLLNMPSNQPPKHTKCWTPFYLSPGQFTIVLVEKGVNGHKKHDLGTVDTEAQAIDWADNENFSDFGIEDRVTVAAILEGTAFEKEVNHG